MKTFTVWLVISEDDYVIPSNQKHDKHWVIFTRYFLMMQNIVDMSFMHHTKSIIKIMKMSSCQNNRKFLHQKSHGNMICSTVWFVISKRIFIKVPESPTEITKNIKSRSQATVWWYSFESASESLCCIDKTRE